MVPITEDGRLSATHFLDGREKMKALHTRHAEYMKGLGLERGREGSRATHQRVKQFWRSMLSSIDSRFVWKSNLLHPRAVCPTANIYGGVVVAVQH